MSKKKSTELLNVDICVNADVWNDQLNMLENKINLIACYVVESLNLGSYSDVIEVAVILTDDREITELNHKYLGKNKPTNVLSFPACDMDIRCIPDVKKANILLLGDILLAYETIEKEAIEKNILFINHFTHLLVHGILHLVGFDHQTDKEAEQMENLEIAILSHFGVESPYEESTE